MDFKELAEAYERIEETTKRSEITDRLAEVFRSSTKGDLPKVVYLTQGKLYPDFLGIETGVSERTVLDSLSAATGRSESQILRGLDKTGDLGITAENQLKRTGATPNRGLTAYTVYKTFDQIARLAEAEHSERRVRLLASMLSNATPVEAKYLVRIATGKLRLGVADATLLHGLSSAYGQGSESRALVERAYNITSDMGRIASIMASEGVDALKELEIEIGRPIRPMLAERSHDPFEIVERLGEEFVAEYKYDGERVQIHKSGKKVALFSGRLENITEQYPDIAALVKDSVAATNAILEGEIAAMNPETLEILPFHELTRVRSKHATAETSKELPACLFLFDCLYADGRDYTEEAFPERREALARSVRIGGNLNLAQLKIVRSPQEVESFFEKAVHEGCDGIVAKSIGNDSIYKAGGRGWLWIKYKRDFRGELNDTLDLTVVGAYLGRGRRSDLYGSLLMAAYDKKADVFKTVARLGAGFTDNELAARLASAAREKKSSRVETTERPDVWFDPSVVLEVSGAEITLSPVHTCAFNRFREGSGLAVRFPRFTGRLRDDKGPENSTTEREIVRMYESGLKKAA